MDPWCQLQSINAHNGRADGAEPSSSMLSPPKGQSDLGSEHTPPTPRRTHPSSIPSPQHEGLQLLSTNSSESLQSFHTAITSLSCSSIRQTMSPTSTVSSNISFSYSVTSINSYKSRKNVLYPRRAHPPPIMSRITAG